MEKTPLKAIFSYKVKVDFANNSSKYIGLAIIRPEDYKEYSEYGNQIVKEKD